MKADSIRIPINEPTVSGTWWAAYKGVIDTAVGKGMKVVIAYWAYQNGRPADDVAFKNMWQVVVSAYQNNNLVYFDIHNEPYGYGSAWNDAAAQWLADFPGVPRGRVIVAGTGYDDNVNPVGTDARFAGCILQLHIYGFWHTDWTTQKQWHGLHDVGSRPLRGAYARRRVGRADDDRNRLWEHGGRRRLSLVRDRRVERDARQRHGELLLAGPSQWRQLFDDEAQQRESAYADRQ